MAVNAQTTIPQAILDEIVEELGRINFGSLEIYVQNKQVTQITVRNIKKTGVSNGSGHKKPESVQVNNGNPLNPTIRVLTIKK